MKILSVSDQIDPRIYSNSLKQRYGDVEFVISCGDLSYQYLEYIISVLDKPLYFIHGNHDPLEEVSKDITRSQPLGASNLHRKMIRDHGLLITGVEGSIQYNRKTPYQYTQGMMWSHVLSLAPALLFNKMVYGRYLDIFVTHSPPKGIHEGGDWTHQGINAFRWLIDTFKPQYHLHGHIHHYRPDDVIETKLEHTLVINTFRSRLIEIG